VKIYQLLAARSEATEDEFAYASLCEEGIKLYWQREWASARERFRAVLTARPDDRPAQIMAERCASYEKHPPADDWQGIITMATK